MCFAPHLLHRTMDARLRLALCSLNLTTYESDFTDNLEFALYSGQHRHLYNVGDGWFVHDNVQTLPEAMQVSLRRYLHSQILWWIVYLKCYSSSQTPGVLRVGLGRHLRHIECVLVVPLLQTWQALRSLKFPQCRPCANAVLDEADLLREFQVVTRLTSIECLRSQFHHLRCARERWISE